jgi:hypothetical protein
LGDLSAEEEETIDLDRLGKRTTGGVSSGEVIAVLLMANSCGHWVSEYGTYAAKNQY